MPNDATGAEKARQLVAELERERNNLKRKLEDVEKELAIDFGKEREFAVLHGECFEMSQRQYKYEICPFDKAAQKEGGSSTNLGKFDGAEWKPSALGKGDTVEMKFTNGQRCWQGPQRSLTATFVCGGSNKVLAVDEPSKCVYAMRFATPAMCDPEEAARLRQQADQEFRQHEHDEL
eukprot:TRINITY_DN61911_c0_g1_i1.p1 TRINITY_DN61911_c0_g1~~TRINITY_DN61911_c0_g1_i1.p1  ORF type:complete len:177 (+),score=88.66 TRINITY_DN61911_c0_g1_i1:673-1203(+)